LDASDTCCRARRLTASPTVTGKHVRVLMIRSSAVSVMPQTAEGGLLQPPARAASPATCGRLTSKSAEKNLTSKSIKKVTTKRSADSPRDVPADLTRGSVPPAATPVRDRSWQPARSRQPPGAKASLSGHWEPDNSRAHARMEAAASPRDAHLARGCVPTCLVPPARRGRPPGRPEHPGCTTP